MIGEDYGGAAAKPVALSETQRAFDASRQACEHTRKYIAELQTVIDTLENRLKPALLSPAETPAQGGTTERAWSPHGGEFRTEVADGIASMGREFFDHGKLIEAATERLRSLIERCQL